MDKALQKKVDRAVLLLQSVARGYDDVYECFTRELFYERQEKWEYDKTHQLFGRPDYKQDLQDFFHVKL